MKPKFRSKLFALAALTPLLAAPLASHADDAIDACIEAFVSSTLPKDQPVKIRKVSAGRSSLTYGTQEVEVTARVSRTGAQVAKATCVVDRNNQVIALDGVPTKQRVAGALEKTAAR